MVNHSRRADNFLFDFTGALGDSREKIKSSDTYCVAGEKKEDQKCKEYWTPVV